MRFAAATAVLALCGLAAPSPSGALAQSADTWKWTASIYVYSPEVRGQTNFPPSGGGEGISLGPYSVIDNLNAAFMGTLEASNGRWGGFTDLIYLDLGNSKSGTRNLTVAGQPLPIDASANLDYNLRGTAWTLAGTYRAYTLPRATLDAIFGVRWFDIKQTLKWDLVGNVGNFPINGRSGNYESRLSNVDAIVGFKGRAFFGEGGKWFAPTTPTWAPAIPS